ncbi:MULTISPECIES: hypothetical protein [Exiguobacterium]|uniref:Uncharacterized protein n=1 Tax=Exiguobacterium antarcticum TaxID=132920 RepID=A0ABT6R5D0_9BACL|nr:MULTISPECIES: hypothetical protein [Exiguobacterium]MCT4780406.1 hypothetical protein [Exiguobacterium soli]MDI3236146.1 hypothetical protein [Exiguobacterium antarcticum]
MFRNSNGSTQVWLNDLGVCLFVLIGLTLATHPVSITASGRLMYDESIWLSTDELSDFINFFFPVFILYFLIVNQLYPRFFKRQAPKKLE